MTTNEAPGGRKHLSIEEKYADLARPYLREIGTVPLLTREEEVEIAKRIEKGLRTVIKALSRSPVVVAEILRSGDLL